MQSNTVAGKAGSIIGNVKAHNPRVHLLSGSTIWHRHLPRKSKHRVRKRPVRPKLERPVDAREARAYPHEGERAEAVEDPAGHAEVVDEGRQARGGEQQEQARPCPLQKEDHVSMRSFPAVVDDVRGV